MTAPEPSRWISSASSAVPMTMRVGRMPTVRRMRAMIGIEHAGIGHDAEIEDGEDEHAGDRREAVMPAMMNLLVSQPKPAIRQATTGIRMKAMSGDIRLEMMTRSSTAMVATPSNAKLCISPPDCSCRDPSRTLAAN